MAKTPNMRSILEQYKADLDQSVPHRIAALMDYCSKKMPKRPIPWQWVVKVVNVRKSLPREDAREVELMRARLGSARTVCEETYGRSIYSMPGQGIRGTTDDEDLARTQHEKNIRRTASSIRRQKATEDLIDPSKIRTQAVKDRVLNVKRATRILAGDDVLKRLEAPKDEE